MADPKLLIKIIKSPIALISHISWPLVVVVVVVVIFGLLSTVW